MEGIVLIVLVVAAAHAIERGRAYAWGRTKSATRAKWQSYKAKRPVVARGSRAGVATGRAIGAGAIGAIEGIRGFGAGARIGWSEGKTKAYAWHERRRATVVAPRFAEPAAVSATGTDGGYSWSADEPAVATPAGTGARLHLVDNDQPTDAPAVAESLDGSGVHTTNSSEGTDEMTIDTATGGDVQTLEQLIAELETIGKEAAAELEDAQGDAQRAREDSARVEAMVASLAQLDLDKDSLNEISALAEDSASRLSAAEARQNAAESRAAHAQQAIDGVRSRHQLMQEAHDATPHAADKRFYGH